jgi:hypothetical protein
MNDIVTQRWKEIVAGYKDNGTVVNVPLADKNSWLYSENAVASETAKPTQLSEHDAADVSLHEWRDGKLRTMRRVSL